MDRGAVPGPRPGTARQWRGGGTVPRPRVSLVKERERERETERENERQRHGQGQTDRQRGGTVRVKVRGCRGAHGAMGVA